MIENCDVKTITEVVGKNIKISSAFLEVDEKPTILKADLLQQTKTVNKTDGKEGELIITHRDNENIATINDNGDLILSPASDDVNNYRVNKNGYLIYEQ
jgi:hypothetical protein|nr:MAG TPA: hypothetical protein [Herelleviridae sp.]